MVDQAVQVDKDPQDAEVLDVIAGGGPDGIEPQVLIDTLVERSYDLSSVIEALQRGIEREKIWLNGQGMVVPVASMMAHAA